MALVYSSQFNWVQSQEIPAPPGLLCSQNGLLPPNPGISMSYLPIAESSSNGAVTAAEILSLSKRVFLNLQYGVTANDKLALITVDNLPESAEDRSAWVIFYSEKFDVNGSEVLVFYYAGIDGDNWVIGYFNGQSFHHLLTKEMDLTLPVPSGIELEVRVRTRTIQLSSPQESQSSALPLLEYTFPNPLLGSGMGYGSTATLSETSPVVTFSDYSVTNLLGSSSSSPLPDELLDPDGIIAELAKDYEYDPLRLYEFVLNEVAFAEIPERPKSKKGASGTLYEKEGGIIDQCSLLIALLNECDEHSPDSITARYAMGSVVMSGKDWRRLYRSPLSIMLYYNDLDNSGSFSPGDDVWLDTGTGAPGKYDDSHDIMEDDGGDGWQTPDEFSGELTEYYLRDERIYQKGNMVWVRLDLNGSVYDLLPWAKFYDDATSKNISWRDVMPRIADGETDREYTGEEFLNRYINNHESLFDENGNSHFGSDQPDIIFPKLLRRQLESNNMNFSYDQIGQRLKITPRFLQSFNNPIPEIITCTTSPIIGNTLPDLSSEIEFQLELRMKILKTEDGADIEVFNELFPLSKLHSARLTLSFQKTSGNDYGTNMEARVRLVTSESQAEDPEINVESSYSLGDPKLKVIFSVPQWNNDQSIGSRSATIGNHEAFLIDFGNTSARMLKKRSKELDIASLILQYDFDPTDSDDDIARKRDQVFGEVLTAVGTQYYHRQQVWAHECQDLFGVSLVTDIRIGSVFITSSPAGVARIGLDIFSGRIGRLRASNTADLSRRNASRDPNVLSGKNRLEPLAAERDAWHILNTAMSAYEHGVLQDVLGQDAAGSSMRRLRLAMDQFEYDYDQLRDNTDVSNFQPYIDYRKNMIDSMVGAFYPANVDPPDLTWADHSSLKYGVTDSIPVEKYDEIVADLAQKGSDGNQHHINLMDFWLRHHQYRKHGGPGTAHINDPHSCIGIAKQFNYTTNLFSTLTYNSLTLRANSTPLEGFDPNDSWRKRWDLGSLFYRMETLYGMFMPNPASVLQQHYELYRDCDFCGHDDCENHGWTYSETYSRFFEDFYSNIIISGYGLWVGQGFEALFNEPAAVSLNPELSNQIRTDASSQPDPNNELVTYINYDKVDASAAVKVHELLNDRDDEIVAPLASYPNTPYCRLHWLSLSDRDKVAYALDRTDVKKYAGGQYNWPENPVNLDTKFWGHKQPVHIEANDRSTTGWGWIIQKTGKITDISITGWSSQFLINELENGGEGEEFDDSVDAYFDAWVTGTLDNNIDLPELEYEYTSDISDVEEGSLKIDFGDEDTVDEPREVLAPANSIYSENQFFIILDDTENIEANNEIVNTFYSSETDSGVVPVFDLDLSNEIDREYLRRVHLWGEDHGYFIHHLGMRDAQTESSVSDPVNIISGDFYVDDIDLSVIAPMPITIRRTYFSANDTVSELGYGWRINHDYTMFVNETAYSELYENRQQDLQNNTVFVISASAEINVGNRNGTAITYSGSPSQSTSTYFTFVPLADRNKLLTNATESGASGISNPFNSRVYYCPPTTDPGSHQGLFYVVEGDNPGFDPETPAGAYSEFTWDPGHESEEYKVTFAKFLALPEELTNNNVNSEEIFSILETLRSVRGRIYNDRNEFEDYLIGEGISFPAAVIDLFKFIVKIPYLTNHYDSNQNRIDFEYDDTADRRQPVTIRSYSRLGNSEELVNWIKFKYEDGRLRSLICADGRQIEYQYDTHGDLTKVIHPDNSEYRYEYHHMEYTARPGIFYSTHRLTRIEKPDGRFLVNRYFHEGDNAGLMLRKGDFRIGRVVEQFSPLAYNVETDEPSITPVLSARYEFKRDYWIDRDDNDSADSNEIVINSDDMFYAPDQDTAIEFCYIDQNANGKFDFNFDESIPLEHAWIDINNNNAYDADIDRIFHGEPSNGDTGIKFANILFEDLDNDTVFDANEPIWLDTDYDGSYVDAKDYLIIGLAPIDSSVGFPLFNFKVLTSQTDFYDPKLNKTSYHYDAKNRIVAKERFIKQRDGNGDTIMNGENFLYELYSTIEKKWDGPNLVAVLEKDSQENILSHQEFVTDSLGNINEMTRTGRLTGHFSGYLALNNQGNPVNGESVSTYYTYTDNLLTSITVPLEMDPYGTVTRYHYDNNRNLIKEFICDADGDANPLNNPVKIRKFYEYSTNGNGIVERIITDNGVNEHELSLTAVTQRTISESLARASFPAHILPETVSNYYYDLNSQTEVLLTKNVIDYNNQGLPVTTHTYDENDLLRYSTTTEYDAMSRPVYSADALGNTTSILYDGNGNQLAIDGPRPDNDALDIIINTYDFSNRLTSTTQFDGNNNKLITQFDYDLNSNKITETDVFGNFTTFHYDDLDRIIQRISPRVNVWQDDQLESINPSVSTNYDDLGLIQIITDPGNQSTTVTYNLNGNITKTEFPDNTSTQVIYYLSGSIQTSINKNQSYSEYRYDFLQRPLEERFFIVNNAFQWATSIQYFDHFNKTSETDAEGNTFTFIYDEAGRPQETIGPPDPDVAHRSRTEYHYDSLNRQHRTKTWFGIENDDYSIDEIVFDNLNRVNEQFTKDHNDTILTRSSFDYDEAGNQTDVITYPETAGSTGATTMTTFDPQGNPLTITDTLANVTMFDYDFAYVDNNISKLKTARIDALNNQQITINDVLGRPHRLENRNASDQILAASENTYDANGNLARVVNTVYGPAPSYDILRTISTQWEYNDVNQVTKLVEAVGSTEEKETHYHYNEFGQLDIQTNPNGVKLHSIYDDHGRLKSFYSSDGTVNYEYHYDNNNNLTAVNDANGNPITRTYDAYNRLETETQTSGQSIEYAYDRSGRKKRVLLLGNKAIDYLYNAAFMTGVSRQSNVDNIDDLSVFTEYTHRYDNYDLTGNLLQSTTLSGDRINYSHDKLHRLTDISLGPNDDSWGFGLQDGNADMYDPVGNLLNFKILGSNNNDKSYLYDDLYQLKKETGILNPEEYDLHNFEYTYDSLGNRLTNTDFNVDGNSGITTANSYNNLNQLVSQNVDGTATGNIRIPVNGIIGPTRDISPGSPVTSVTVWVDNQTSYNATVTNHKWEVLDNGRLGILLGVGTSHTVTVIAESDNGEINQKEITVYYDPNTVTSHAYDKNGNLVQKVEHVDVDDGYTDFLTTTTFDYDALNRLISIEKNGDDKKKLLQFSYDAFNRRISKAVYEWEYSANSWFLDPDKSEWYLYDGQNDIGTIDVYGQITVLRVLGIGFGAEIGAAVIIEMGDNGQYYYPIHDHRGNVVNLRISSSGSIVERYQYTAFGLEWINDQQTSVSAIGNPWRFSSKRVDEETGLVYFGRRYYDPTTGRWLTADPSGYSDGPNLYAYVSNNPMIFFDLYGLFGVERRAAEFALSLAGSAISFTGDLTRAVLHIDKTAPAIYNGILDTVDGNVVAGMNGFQAGAFTFTSNLPVANLIVAALEANDGVDLTGQDIGRTITGTEAASNLFTSAGETITLGAGSALALTSKIDEVADAAQTASKISQKAPKSGANPLDVRFSQPTISQNFSSNGTVDNLARQLRNGKSVDDIPAIRVVERNGELITLDNRRLAAFQNGGVNNIPIQRVSLSDPSIKKEFLQKFNPVNGGQNIVVTPNAAGRKAAESVLRQSGKIR